MDENKIMENTKTGEKSVVWDHAPFFLKICAAFSAFYVFCLYRNPSGITYPVFFAGLLGLYLYVMKREQRKIKKLSVFYMAAICLLGFSVFLTGNEEILFFNKAGIFLLCSVLFLHDACRDENWNFTRHIVGILQFYGQVLLNIFSVFKIKKKAKTEKENREKKDGKAVYVVIGLLISFTLLCLILPLLLTADQNFEALFSNSIQWIFSNIRVPEHVIPVFLMFCWGTVFFFSLFLCISKRNISQESSDQRNQEPVVAVTVLLVTGTVYFLFCMLQISYLFTGGMELPDGYTYSEFARQGFFQLLFVCALNLAIVLVCLEFFRESRMLKTALTIFSICTYIMLISSACRMYLYIQAYLLTRMRVYVLAALLVLAILLGGMTFSIFRKKFPLFRFSVIVVTCVYIFLSLSRMDAWIAGYNISRTGLAVTYENQYLLTLSSDAAGVFSDAVQEGAEKTELADDMLDYYFNEMEEYRKEGVRSFNFSHYRAVRAAEAYFEETQNK